MKTLELLFLCALLGISTAWWDTDIGQADTDTDPALVYTSYVRVPYCTPSSAIVYPKTTQEVVDIVSHALRHGRKVKALGSHHSKNDIICSDGTPIGMDNFNSIKLNPDNTVTVGGGVKMRALLLFLEDNDRAMIMVPKYTGISVAGAIATASHGSSLKHTPTISDQTVSMTVVTGLGHVQIITGDHLRAWKTHLGLLGIVTQVTLTTVPQFKVNQTRTREPEVVLADGSILERARTSDFLELQWFPNQGVATINQNTYVDVNTPGNCFETFFTEATPQSAAGTKFLFDRIQETRRFQADLALEQMSSYGYHSQVIGAPPVISDDGITLQNPGVGLSWRMMAGQCFNCFYAMGNNSYYFDDDEIAIDAKELPKAYETIKAIVKDEPLAIISIGLAMRFLKQSDSYMSFTNGWKETVVIELVTPSRNDPYNKPKLGNAAYQAIIQALITKHNGRPHWGKNGLGYLGRSVLLRHPGRLAFLIAMAKYDPAGVFMNKFGRRLLGRSTHMDIHPKVTHCALENYCICSENSQCADGQICTTVSDGDRVYPVCKDVTTYPDPPLIFYDPHNKTSVINAVVASIS